MEIAPYSQSDESFRTSDTILFGVRVGPESNCRWIRCPVARIFTWVPPISMTSTFISDFDLRGLLQHLTLGGNDAQQFVPGLNKRLGPLGLELVGQSVDLDPGFAKLGEDKLAVASIGRHDGAELAMIGKGN